MKNTRARKNSWNGKRKLIFILTRWNNAGGAPSAAIALKSWIYQGRKIPLLGRTRKLLLTTSALQSPSKCYEGGMEEKKGEKMIVEEAFHAKFVSGLTSSHEISDQVSFLKGNHQRIEILWCLEKEIA